MNISDLISCLNDLKNNYSKKLEIFKSVVLTNAGEIIILGNGGSNAIASHISEDYTKTIGKKSICFSDAARLTCYANDYGYENAFVQFLKEFTTQNSLVILISSSGNSSNILKCANYCKELNISYIILTGFHENNKLKAEHEKTALLSFWINSKDYGIVECCHEIILHSII